MVVLHLRITSNDFTLTEVESFIKTLSPLKYIVAQEIVPYNHYHCHFIYDINKWNDYQKRKLGKIVTDHFKLEGNKQYGISKDKGRSAVYTVKDGKFVSCGYTETEIDLLYSESSSKVSFKDTLRLLYDLVNSQEIDFETYCQRYILAHVEALKPLSDFRVESHFRTIFLGLNRGHIKFYASCMENKATQFSAFNY